MTDYLTTLRRIPADVRLAMATREFDMNNGKSCVCGWAIREHLHRVTSETLALRQITNGPASFLLGRAAFGGSLDEWCALFVAYRRDPVALELAFVQALDEAVQEAA